MDLQNRLGEVTKFFINEKIKSCQVFIHEPRENNLFRFCVVISVKFNSHAFNGSSSSSNLFDAFIKALCELGENMISSKLGLENRSGIAGGFVLSNCIERAKAEIIERDAFLYHYRNVMPFIKIKCSQQLNEVRFRLNSIDPNYNISLVMNEDYLNDPESCLILGTASKKNEISSLERAFCEYSSMYFHHKEFINCSSLGPDSTLRTKADFHHQHSKSLENKLIFKSLCLGECSFDERFYDTSLWKIEKLKSPLKFFKYIRVEHPQLAKLKFGYPESFPQFDKLIYHPFW